MGDDRWDGAVPFDEEFVRSAPVREPAGADRIARARRISRTHVEASPWRAPGPAPSSARRRVGRRADWRAAGAALVVIAVATGVLAAAGPDRLQGVIAASGAPVGDGGPVPSRPADAQETRVLPLPPAPEGEGGYRFLHENRGAPIAFDPCRPVHYVVRPDGAPADGAALLGRAFGQLSSATGLAFVFDGGTDERYADDRPLVQPERYGDRWAPVLVVWSDEQEEPRLAGPTMGFAGPRVADPDGLGPRLVSGGVVLDAPQLAASPESGMSLLLHELGHLLGLDHVDDPLDLMHEASPPVEQVTPAALRGLRALGDGACFWR